MSLLVDIASQALDPGYAEAAARRGDSGDRAKGRRPLLAAVAVMAVTLLIVLAAVQTHLRAPAAAQSRARLVTDVQQETAAVSGLEQRLAGLRSDTTSLRDRLLASSAAGAALSRLLREEELAAGTGAVAGPGLRVRLADGSGAGDQGNRVLDRDVQSVVNALWAAGAEAIAVNGQRLTAQSAIRQAGDAVLVNFVPVDSPYVIDAVGDPVGLETAFVASPAAARMRTLAQVYGLGFGYQRADTLTLPAAPELSVHYARPVAAPAKGRPR